jgi:hypothetical protein
MRKPARVPDADVVNDARSRQRRHRGAAALTALTAAALGGWLALGGAGGGRGIGAAHTGQPSTPAGALGTRNAPAIASRVLAPSVDYFTVERYGNAMLLLSGVDSSGADCVWTLVSARTLRVTASFRRSCAAPAVAAEPLVPVNVERPNMTSTVRVARPNPDPRRVVLGPVVMVHDEVSDTHLEWAYGAGLMWIYDVAAIDPSAAALHQSRRATRAEIVEVSLADGRVVRTVVTRQLDRPFLLAGADGLWIVPSPETGVAAPAPTYLLAPGASVPRVVLRAGDHASWALVSGHTLWEDILTFGPHAKVREELWRLDGAGGTARRVGPVAAVTNQPAFQSGSDTLWTLNSITDPGTNNTCTRQQVVAIDAANGRSHTVRTLELPLAPCEPVPWNQPFGGAGSGQQFAAGAFFFLDSEQSQTTLYRVRP